MGKIGVAEGFLGKGLIRAFALKVFVCADPVVKKSSVQFWKGFLKTAEFQAPRHQFSWGKEAEKEIEEENHYYHLSSSF